MEKLLLNIKTLLDVIDGFSETTIWRLIKSGEFPAPKIIGAQGRRWRREDIEFWAEDPETYQERLTIKLAKESSAPAAAPTTHKPVVAQ